MVFTVKMLHLAFATTLQEPCFTGSILVNDNLIEENLYQGTAKSAEGYGAKECFAQAKVDGMAIEIHWQDSDSSSSNSVHEIFPDAKVMICAGHAARAHRKKLQSLAKREVISDEVIKQYQGKYPLVTSVRCHCKRHSSRCGCLSDSFIEQSRKHFFCILSDSSSPHEFSEIMVNLAQHS